MIIHNSILVILQGYPQFNSCLGFIKPYTEDHRLTVELNPQEQHTSFRPAPVRAQQLWISRDDGPTCAKTSKNNMCYVPR